ncbi:MAG TPA: hypothetical protein VLT62_21260 [Candidatus Methylomirabilis sp.]|nr:hypothetical protein [Candidatus Methylomirabilis sp.]
MFPVYLKDEGFEPPAEQIYYLVTADGLFQVKDSPVFCSCVRVRGIRGLLPQKDEVRWKLPPIPGPLLQRVVGLFREVYRRYGSEAIVLLLYDLARQEYGLIVPEQHVTGGHLSYVPGETPPGRLRVGTIHSHAEADAFHSPLDDWDEEHDDGLHATVGNLDGSVSLACSLMVDGRRFPLRPRDVFQPVPLDVPEEVWYEALTHIHAEPPPRDSLEGKPAAI